MEQIALGKSSVKIAPLVFGTNIFGWTVTDQSAANRLLDACLDEGITCIDTADAYCFWLNDNAGGQSEIMIGNWLAQGGGRREKAVIATKVAILPAKKGLKPDTIISACEDSLRRLKTDCIDLYQSHWEDPSTPIEDTLKAYQTLIKAGKVRVIGASNYSTARLVEALDVAEKNGLPRYETNQPKYNLYDRYPHEEEVADICHKRGVTVLPYSSLASGFLSGKYRSAKDTEGKARGGAASKYLNARGESVLGALDDVAAAHKAKQTEIALAWLIAQKNVAPIASATTVAQIKELAGALRIKLSAADLAKLNAASDPVKVAA